jgi:hypothetical protein
VHYLTALFNIFVDFESRDRVLQTVEYNCSGRYVKKQDILLIVYFNQKVEGVKEDPYIQNVLIRPGSE